MLRTESHARRVDVPLLRVGQRTAAGGEDLDAARDRLAAVLGTLPWEALALSKGERGTGGAPNMNVLVLSDTHLGPGRRTGSRRRCSATGWTHADAILHAGDITDVAILGALAAFAPTYAVLGNNDHGVALPERRIVDLDGCQVAMIHDSGQAGGRAARLRRWFPDADAVVFGHSHLPWDERDVRADGHVQRHVNPGSATQRRRAPQCTVAWLTIADGTPRRRAHRSGLT